MIVAAAWGCTPAELAACTHGEYRAMVELLEKRAAAMARRKA